VPAPGAPIAPLLDRLASAEAPLLGAEIVLLARFLEAAAAAARRIAAADPPCPALARELEGLGDPRPLLARIARVLDARGRVRDDASPRLVALARETRRARERVYATLERVRSAHRDAFAEDASPLRGGRVLLVLAAGARGRVPGLVHARTGSEKSFYFEPLDAVEENNALQSATAAQEAERERLLAELLAALARAAPLVRALAQLAATLDAHAAALDYAAAAEARLAGVAPRGRARLCAARHPLLDPRLAARRERVLGAAGHTGPVEPLDLELGGGAPRVLLVTGPNAGGKTVALETLGLAALAQQAGLPVPCAPGSELPLCASIVAAVGDEQDLLAERSTFSGRLLRLAEAWRGAGPGSLALLDELGSGTDPDEGAAVAVALLERLLAAGGLAFATTHLASVALAALEREGAGGAAMEFDPESGRPTYRLRPGPPGASEALALARRMALPGDWIARAEELIGPERRALRRSLAELDAARRALARAEAEAARRAAETAAAAERYERERAALAEERRAVARRSEAELRDFREKVAAALAAEEERLRKEFAAGRRRGVASAATARLFAEAPRPEEAPAAEAPGPLAVGATVRHRRLGWTGIVERIDGGRAVATAAGKRLSAALDELVAVAPAVPAERRPRPVRGDDAEQESAPELLLLGFSVEDALAAVDDFLDRALRAGREAVRIVHGHGTGRLRAAIRGHLRAHAAVASHRPGAPNEGGDGATVVELR
jgi:DNA mismatch repair protein MutS2